jgi:RNA methyltransferase, TrmH family
MINRDNKYVKLALKLKTKKYREEENRFIVEGIRFVEEAILSGYIDYILFSQKLFKTSDPERAMNTDCPKFEVENELLKEICDTENPQGIAAVVKKKNWKFHEEANDFIVIADGIQDPGNLGTIIRTADAAGAGAVVITKGTVDVYNDKTLRATMGSIFHLPIISAPNFSELANTLTDMGYEIYAASLESSKYIYDCDFKSKSALLLGNEANGIPEEHMEFITKKIKIPMPGGSESLNVASAAAIIIYEVVRQRENF